MNFSGSLKRLACLAAMTVAASAHAQDRFDVEALDPVTSTAGSVLNVFGARTLERGAYTLALQASYGRKPLSIESAAGDDLGDLVGSVGTLQVLGTFGLSERLDIGVGIPLHRTSAGSAYQVAPPLSVQAASLDKSKVALGDIRVVPRVNLYEHAGPGGFDVALLASLWLPTGSDASYAGESLRVEPRVAVDYATRTWLVAFNAGYMVRGAANVLGTELNDQVRLGLGTNFDLTRGFSVLAEVDAHLNVLADDFGKDDVASEALAGLRYRSGQLVAQLGAGPGIVRGMTAPMYRVLASFEVAGASRQKTLDSDRDDLLDDVDQCVEQAEDRDQFDDEDGCPDFDNDHDGVADASDRCPREAEDEDGWQDADGCPDLDNDGDAIADANDGCRDQAEDKDGWEDDDGCPDSDNDGDGLADADDQCPDEPGGGDERGCPPAQAIAAAVSEERIELRETILFGNNNAEIQASSFALLDTVAKLLADRPEIARVVVEGHTDDRGGLAHNQKLSEARARSVMDALISRGTSAARLSSAGFGSSRPLVANDSAENRAKNRRVELRIDQREAP
jgi:outer membrane protein OmpA-like peptidoglycan-associated protein